MEVVMTRRFFVPFAALALFALIVPVTAQNTRIVVSIPYEFTAGARKLAAGEYLITRAIPSDPRVLAFRGNAKNQKAMVSTNTTTHDETAAHTELVFARYGEVYFLRTVRIRGAREVHDVPVSKAEKPHAAKGDAVLVTIKANE
jgi:hypothetical protein